MNYLVIAIEKDHFSAARFVSLKDSLIMQGGERLPRSGGLEELSAKIRSSGVHVRTIVCIPPSHVASRIVQVPLDSLRKVREILPATLQGETAVPVDELVIDAIRLGNNRFLAVWAKRDDVKACLDSFQSAGIDPQHVTVAWSSWGNIPGIGNTSPVILCDDTSAACLVDSVPVAAMAVQPETRSRQIAALSSMVEEIAGTDPRVTLLMGRQPDDKACGDSPDLQRLSPPRDCTDVFGSDEHFMEFASHYSVAVSCRNASLVDFRRGPFEWKSGDPLVRKKLAVTAALLLLLYVTAVSHLLIRTKETKADIASLDKSVGAVYREVFPAKSKPVDAVAEIKGEIRRLSLSASSDTGVLLAIKSMAEAKGSTINGIHELDVEGRTIRLKGDAPSSQSIQEFKKAVTPLMSTIETGEIKSKPDGTASFSLWGTLKESTR